MSIQNADDTFNLDLNISSSNDQNGLVVFNDVNWSYLSCSANTFIASPATCHFALQTRKYPDGNYFVRAALDDGGTVAADASDSSFYIDNHAPKISFGTVGTDKTVSFQVNDNSYLDNNIMAVYEDTNTIRVYMDRGLPNALQWGMHRIDSNNVWGMTHATIGTMFGQQEFFDNLDTAHVSTTGSWSTITNSSAYGGSYIYSSQVGATATITFTGNKITLLTARNTLGGQANVKIDGRSDLANLLPVDVNGNAFITFYWGSGLDRNAQIPIADDLNSGTHQLVITHRYNSAYPSGVTYVSGAVDQNYLYSFSNPSSFVSKQKIVDGTYAGTANEYVFYYTGGGFMGNGHANDKIQWDADGQEIELLLDGIPTTMNVGDVNIVHSFEFDENSFLSRPTGALDQNIGDVQRKEIFTSAGLDVNYSVRWFNTDTPYSLGNNASCYIAMLPIVGDYNTSQFGTINGTRYLFLKNGTYVGNVIATSALFTTSYSNLYSALEIMNPENSYTPFSGRGTLILSYANNTIDKAYFDICQGAAITPTENQTFTVQSRYTVDYNTASTGTPITITATLSPGTGTFNQETDCTGSSQASCSYTENGIVSGNNTLSVTAADNLGSSSTALSSFYFPFPPDGNIAKIDGYPDNQALPVFSYVRDGNLTIDFNVQNIDVNNLLVDLNYSSQKTQGTGTVIVADLNLNTLGTTGAYHCEDTNFLNATDCGIDWNIATVPDGNYYLLLLVKDGVNTDFNSSDNNFMVDNTAPTVSISSPTDGSTSTSSTVTLQYSGSDSNSGIARYWVAVDSNAAGSFIDNNLNASYSFTGQVNGIHVYYVKATDNADNNSSDANVTVTVSVSGENNNGSGEICGNGYCHYAFETCSSCPADCGACQTAGDNGNGQESGQGALTVKQEESAFLEKEYFSFVDGSIGIIEEGNENLGLNLKRIVTEKEIKISRSMKMFSLLNSKAEQKGFFNKITLFIENISGKNLDNLEILESIPKEFAEKASQIKSNYPFETIKEDPLIKFNLPTLSAGKKVEITYDFNNTSQTKQKIEEAFNKLEAPAVLIAMTEKDNCLGVLCNDSNSCTVDICIEGGCAYKPKCVNGAICDNGKCIRATETQQPIQEQEKTMQTDSIIIVIVTVIGIIAIAIIARAARKKKKKHNLSGW
ncbi:MAG: Ig-like domain-containing protein [Candidatus ainarchaeum sp.]|nr:Ig-like domain-containing protein [Candidatus ainarchaeum sp.]